MHAFFQKLYMACEQSFEIVPNKKAKSSVWNHFGFLKENDGPVSQFLEDLSILLHLLIFLLNDSQSKTYKNSYEVSIHVVYVRVNFYPKMCYSTLL